MEPSAQKTWGGRFEEAPSQLMQTYSESVSFDRRLAVYDLRCSWAHSSMLAKIGLLTSEERDAIHAGLEAIGREIEAGTFQWSTEWEDVHMNIEQALTRSVPAAAKLHTGRSRNDQVATDCALYLKDSIETLDALIRSSQAALLTLAERNESLWIPGYTHLHRAQPVPVAHHLLAYIEMLDRDRSRFQDLHVRVNRSPLGSGALAGSTLPLDREETARLLGFIDQEGNPLVTRNSMDAIGSRDSVLEMVSNCSILAIHLSRLAEDLILWSSTEFGFVRLPDAFTTGSSLMPQKKNPDAMELMRGKAARVIGHSTTLQVLVKGLPLTYNRDLQEDKPALFDAVEQVRQSLSVLTAMLPEVRFNTEVCQRAVTDPLLFATDLADALVLAGVPFREAHHQVGALVKAAETLGVSLRDLDQAKAKGIAPQLPDDWKSFFSVERSLSLRKGLGAPSPQRVRAEIERWKTDLGLAATAAS